MGQLIFVEKRHGGDRTWTELESCVKDLLYPSYPNDRGQLEDLEDQIGHIRDCLARYIANTGPTTALLGHVFYTDIELKEIDEE